jgi:hypothetical protein
MLVLKLARTDLRRRRGRALALAVFVGLGLCVSLAALAGARRTQTAYPRMLKDGLADDLLVNPNSGTDSKLDPAAVRALPQVMAMAKISGIAGVPDRDGHPDLSLLSPLTELAGDAQPTTTVDQPKMLAGRMPDPDGPDEIAVDDAFARLRHVHVGSTLTWHFLRPSDLARAERSGDPPVGLTRHLRVVGVVIPPDEVLRDKADESMSVVFSHRVLDFAFSPYYGLELRLRHGAQDIPAVEREIRAMVPHETIVFQTRSNEEARVERVTRPSTLALLVFAFVGAPAVLLLGGQALVRHVEPTTADGRALLAMGCTRRDVFGLMLLRVAAIASVAAVVALAVSIVASPLFPVGTARRAEPHPGLAADWPLLVGGTVLLSILLVAVCALPLWHLAARAGRAAEAGARVAFADPLVRRLHSRPAMAVGVRHALVAGEGDQAIPVRSALIGSSIAVAWVVAAAVFAASLWAFVDTPARWGWHWDALVTVNADNSAGPVETVRPAVVRTLRRQRAFSAVSVGEETQADFGGHSVTGIALSTVKGPSAATLSSGRAPTGPSEVAFGSQTMRLLHTHVDGTVPVRLRDGTTGRVHVVGQAVFPGLSAYPGADPTALGTGVLMSEAGFRRFGEDLGSQIVAVSFGRGGSPAVLHRAIDRYEHGATGSIETISTSPLRSSDIEGLIEARLLPYLLAGVLAVLGLAAVIHSLSVAVRRRRGELAALKAIGFRSRQIGATVRWHAMTVVAVALVIGVPLGIAGGRLAWTFAAHGLGVSVAPAVPALVLIGFAAAVLLASNLIAIVPAQIASRVTVVRTLQAE